MSEQLKPIETGDGLDDRIAKFKSKIVFKLEGGELELENIDL